jgi:hypothetical protein
VVKAPLYILWLAGPLAVLAYTAAWRLVRERGSQGLLLVGWLVSTMLGIVVAGRFYDHYYALIFPPLALLAALGIDTLTRMKRRNRDLLGAVLALSFIPMIALNVIIYAQPNVDERHLAKFGPDGQSLWETDSDRLAAWIAERTGPDDYIYNFGFQSELYFLSDRRSPTRYLFDHPFAADQRHIDRAIAELEANPPLYVLDTASYEKDNLYQYFASDVYYWFRERYDLVGNIYYADVYRLKGTGDGG